MNGTIYLVELPLPPGGFRSTSEDMLASTTSAASRSGTGAGGTMKGNFFVTFALAIPPTLSAIARVVDD
jgi:hypothetical protein